MKKLNMFHSIKKAWIAAPTLVFIGLIMLMANQSLAQAKKPWNAPAAASQMKSPLTVDANVLKDAKKNYQLYCTPCHGNSGKGDGAAAASLNPKPADHTSEAVQKDSDGTLFWKMSEGRNPMPSYKQILTDNQRWELVAYIRTLKKK